MAKLGETFDMFDDTTPPRADGQKREESREDAPPPPPKPPRQGNNSRRRRAAQEPAQIDKRVKAFWRTNLQNAARKLARDRAQRLASEDAWVDTVADARDAGVPENVIVEAAAGADVEVPE